MIGSGGGVPGLMIAGFGDGGLAIVIFILGNENAFSFAANVELLVEDLEDVEAVRRDDDVFARCMPRRGTGCSGGGGAWRCCSGDVAEIAKLSSLPGSTPAKPGGAATGAAGCAIVDTGAVGVLSWE